MPGRCRIFRHALKIRSPLAVTTLRPSFVRLLMAALLGVSCVANGRAAGVPAPEVGTEPRPRVGLVLSGGGARGFAHVGVLKVLEEVGLPVDVITAASMGAVVGGLYAAGYSAAELERLVVQAPWTRLGADPLRRETSDGLEFPRFRPGLTLRMDRSGAYLPQGLFSADAFAAMLLRLTAPVHAVADFRELPIPFACTATDLETGSVVRLDRGSLMSAIQASTALPTLVAPVDVGGRRLVDGGIRRNLPAEDARALGADVLVCVDASQPTQPADSLRSLTDVMTQSISFHLRETFDEQLAHCDVLIRPATGGLPVFAFDRGREMIRRGEDAARAVQSRLASLADSVGRVADPHRYHPSRASSLLLSRIEVRGATPKQARHLRTLLALPTGAPLSLDALETALTRVRRLYPFDLLAYHLVAADGEGAALVLTLRGDGPALVGLDLRYEGREGAALLVHAIRPGLPGGSSRVAAQLRLGRTLRLRARHDTPLDRRLAVWWTLEADALRSGPLTALVPADARPQFWLARLEQGPSFGPAGARSLALRGLVEGYDRGAGPLGVVLGAEGSLQLRRTATVGRATGAEVLLKGGLYRQGGARFTRRHVAARAEHVLSRRVTLLGRVVAARAGGPGVPVHHRLHVGGTFAYLPFPDRQFHFLGRSPAPVTGGSLGLVGAGLRVGLSKQWWAELHANVGRGLDGEAATGGGGLLLTRPTLLGPVRLGVSGGGTRASWSLSAALGQAF